MCDCSLILWVNEQRIERVRSLGINLVYMRASSVSVWLILRRNCLGRAWKVSRCGEGWMRRGRHVPVQYLWSCACFHMENLCPVVCCPLFSTALGSLGGGACCLAEPCFLYATDAWTLPPARLESAGVWIVSVLYKGCYILQGPVFPVLICVYVGRWSLGHSRLCGSLDLMKIPCDLKPGLLLAWQVLVDVCFVSQEAVFLVVLFSTVISENNKL